MGDRVLVLGFKTYDFKDEKSGKQLSGGKISYITFLRQNQPNCIGNLPIQIKASKEMCDNLKALPGIYDIQYSMVPGKNNVPQLEVSNFNYVGEVELDDLFKYES